jgi:four helix bundle protein
MVGMMPYERFGAWRACYDLALAVHRTTETFPREQRYGITSQARRAALGAAPNIAEGSARRGRAEFARFLDIAAGSLAELACVLRMSRDLEYLSTDEWQRLDRLRANASRLTWRLYSRLRGIGRPRVES